MGRDQDMPGSTDWEAVYRERIPTEICSPRKWLVDHISLYPDSGYCFEAAVGLGGNMRFLLDRGYKVFAADLSVQSTRYVKRMFPEVRVIRTDLQYFVLPANAFSLICQFYFLEWSLLDQFQQALAPGGIVVVETLTSAMLETKPDIFPGHLLKPGQLREYFKDWQILDYREGWVKSDHGGDKSIASIVAKK
jgi:hypothetical protein